MDTNPSEKARIDQIRKAMRQQGIVLEDISTDIYPAVALHSNSTLIAVNETAEQMFKYGPGEMDYLNAWLLFPPESGQALMQHLVNHSEEPYRVKAKRQDGTLFLVELVASEFLLERELIRSVLLREVDEL